MDKLKVLEKEQTNELLRLQIADYRNFFNELLEIGKVMTKKFYVVVPYSGITRTKKNFGSRLLETFKPAVSVTMSKKRMTKYLNELSKRVDFITNGLGSIGLKSVQLDTQSLIELFYNTYNPEIAEAQKMTDINKLRVEEI